MKKKPQNAVSRLRKLLASEKCRSASLERDLVNVNKEVTTMRYLLGVNTTPDLTSEVRKLKEYQRQHEGSISTLVADLRTENHKLWEMVRVAMKDPRIEAMAEEIKNKEKDSGFDSFLNMGHRY